MAETRLLINADDFGLTPGINRAILDLNAAGVLTSTTLMATGPAFRTAVHSAFVQTSLDIGCHIVLVDGHPVLPHTQIPTLATAHGFRPTLGNFLSDLHRGRIHASDIQAEAIAQIQRIQSSGLTVTHIDTHKHTHIFGRVLAPVLAAARHCGVPAIRNPFEPAWSLRATRARDAKRRLQVMLLNLRRRSFLKTVRSAGLVTTDGALGILATGELDTAILRRILDAMPPGTWELVCHPAFIDQELTSVNTRLIDSREVERAALLEVIPQYSLPLVAFPSLATSTASFRVARASYAGR